MARSRIEQADIQLAAAGREADQIISGAKKRAEEIAGEAYAAMNRAKDFADTAQAMKNIVDGYGDAYIVPTYSLLDDLADEFGHTEAGQKLKEARETTRAIIKAGRAATCDYVEANRRDTAIRFVIGSFGDEVFKIGMTRRLEPKDRIRELGDASVPFEFDIHAMIYSDDAPGLEKSLHRHFLRQQMNKVNPRKEFFRLSLADIRREVEGLEISAHWTMVAEAHDYRESLRIEQQIKEDPSIAQEWTKHQMALETEDIAEEMEA